MPQQMTDGPLGLEARHRLTNPSGYSVLMNQKSSVPGIHFDEMPNFYSLPDADDNRMPHSGRMGEFPLTSYTRGKTFTVVGRVIGTTAQEVRVWARVLRRILAERDQEITWRVDPDPAYGITTNYWEATLRVMQLDIDERWGFSPNDRQGPFQQEFQAGFRMSDPRWYWNQTQDSGEQSGTFSVENQGNIHTDPVIVARRATASAADVVIYNDTTGRKLQFAQVTGPGQLTLDFKERTALWTPDGGSAEDSMWRIVTHESDWWHYDAIGLPPGFNTLRSLNLNWIRVTFKHAML